MKQRLFEILLVEDNAGDVLLTREALNESKLLHRLTVAEDGRHAMAVLRQEPGYADARRPDLVLLDLNLPRMTGVEVLAAIRHDPALATIPVVMLTTSDAERDVGDCYQQGANCYITKPVDVSEFIRIVQSVEHFWLQIVTLPPVGTGDSGYAARAARHGGSPTS